MAKNKDTMTLQVEEEAPKSERFLTQTQAEEKHAKIEERHTQAAWGVARKMFPAFGIEREVEIIAQALADAEREGARGDGEITSESDDAEEDADDC